MYTISFIVGSASRGLRNLRDARKKKYRNRSPQRTALEDLMSQYRLEKEQSDTMLLNAQKACSSNIDDSLSDFTDDGVKSPTRPREVVPFEVAHPPSPKVSKGPNVKHTRIVMNKPTELSTSSDLSSDIEMRLSGVIASGAVRHAERLSSPTDKVEDSSGGKGFTLLYVHKL